MQNATRQWQGNGRTGHFGPLPQMCSLALHVPEFLSPVPFFCCWVSYPLNIFFARKWAYVHPRKQQELKSSYCGRVTAEWQGRQHDFLSCPVGRRHPGGEHWAEATRGAYHPLPGAVKSHHVKCFWCPEWEKLNPRTRRENYSFAHSSFTRPLRGVKWGPRGGFRQELSNVARNTYLAFLFVCVANIIYSDTKPLIMPIAVTILWIPF